MRRGGFNEVAPFFVAFDEPDIEVLSGLQALGFEV